MSIQLDSLTPTRTCAAREAPIGLVARASQAGLAERLGAVSELAKPRLSALAVAASLVGYGMADGGAGDRLGALTLGSALLAASSSALNQFLEREYDREMRRTRERPLPSGRLREEEALGLGLLWGAAGSLVLLQGVNLSAALVGLCILLGYVLVYTPLKRLTDLNTYVGAVFGALPVVMGFAAAEPQVDERAALLFLIVFFWQLPHFWAIAWMHRVDYREAGFHMLSRYDADGRLSALSGLAATLVLLPVTLSPSLFRITGPAYFAGALALGLVFLAAGAVFAIRPSDRSARGVFHVSICYLPALFVLMLIDKVGP